jgi:signal transduction histidine kinase/phage shock protein PspC (stress-responsive transcriptional regulator)
MTATTPHSERPTGATGGAPREGVRRAVRDTRAPVIGGVAGGLARHLGLPVLWVRVGFLVAVAFGGLGFFLYAGLWLVLPADSRFETAAPGLEGASRDGRRPRRIHRLSDAGPAIALAALAIGVLLIAQAVLGGAAIFWPVVLGVAGLALVWRQADEAQRERWLDSTGRIAPTRIVFGRGGWASWTRLVVGLLLVVSAIVLVSLDESTSLTLARDTLLVVLLAVGGVAVVAGPWIYRLAADLTAERAERVRSQDRADVAAHLHDSVLQTLALIQKNAHDGPVVARLARAQERDLRAWLYSEETTDERTVAGALRAAAAAVEDAHGVAVEVVVVGDRDHDEALVPIVQATREALTNAAKHSGVPRVDVYAEIGPDAIDVFVRDRGAGFDPDTVPDDRFGVRRSIRDRMTRHGGTAEIRSHPGEGTEVRLHLSTERPTRAGDDDDH